MIDKATQDQFLEFKKREVDALERIAYAIECFVGIADYSEKETLENIKELLDSGVPEEVVGKTYQEVEDGLNQ